MKTLSKEGFIEVYDADGELTAQKEFPNLLAAYDARKSVHEEYADFDFGHLKITDEDGTIHFEREAKGAETFCGSELISLVRARENAKAKKSCTTRKEISKTDYKFFIGRIEKIAGGQVAFMKDTQKKAVELLGEKIPQNVFDAADNYKAFNMWLGREINPIIVSDSGYKEEIRVFGDGYDFFEVKEYSQSVEENSAIEVTAQSGEVYSLPDGDFALHGKKIFDLLNHELASFDTKKAAENAADELEKAFERGDKTFSFENDAVETVGENAQVKVAEIKNRPRKSCIDWTDAIFQNVTVPEIFKAQKFLRKYLKLGQLDLAENIFAMLKTLCKNYRVA